MCSCCLFDCLCDGYRVTRGLVDGKGRGKGRRALGGRGWRGRAGSKKSFAVGSRIPPLRQLREERGTHSCGGARRSRGNPAGGLRALCGMHHDRGCPTLASSARVRMRAKRACSASRKSRRIVRLAQDDNITAADVGAREIPRPAGESAGLRDDARTFSIGEKWGRTERPLFSSEEKMNTFLLSPFFPRPSLSVSLRIVILSGSGTIPAGIALRSRRIPILASYRRPGEGFSPKRRLRFKPGSARENSCKRSR
jgi:hypothetical protein